MIRLKQNGHNYLITFKRIYKTKVTLVSEERYPTGETYCFIEEIHGNENEYKYLAAMGVAQCSQKEQFSREKGRKYALARAVNNLLPSGPCGRTEAIAYQRAEFWAAYFGRQPVFETVIFVDGNRNLPCTFTGEYINA